MSIIKELINTKIKTLTVHELMKYANEYGFSLSRDQAEEIIKYYRTHDIDPFDSEERMNFFKQLAYITDQDTARKAHRLFIEMIRRYNLEHLF